MWPAAKHLDLIVGVDQHIQFGPTAAPVPMFSPYIGMALDVWDYVPCIGATVWINGLPAAHAGTAGEAVVLHAPTPGPFAPPLPSNESELFMGSSSVLVGGEPQAYFSNLVLSCQSVGMPPPPRGKKRTEHEGQGLLPTSMLIPIPSVRTVTIGGPPVVSRNALENIVWKEVTRRAPPGWTRKLLRSKQIIGRVARALARRPQLRAVLLETLLQLGEQVRNRIPSVLCTLTGHPVDVATGKVLTDKVDFELPGPIPLRWERVWYSVSTYRGALGHGWHGSYDAGLYVADDVVLYRTPDGRFVALPPLEIGTEHFDRAEGITLIHGALGYAVRTKDGLLYRFRDVGRPRGELVLSSISDESGHAIELRYDNRARLMELVDSAGRLLEFAHDAEGRITEVTGPHPDRAGERVTLVQYAYDRGNLVRVLDAVKAPARYRYRVSLLVEEADRNGLRFYFEYDGDDERARCVRTFGDGGIYDHKLTYDDVHGVTTVENSLGHKTRYEHQGGLVVRTTDASGGVTTVEYDDDRKKLAQTDALGCIAQFRYDERGNLIESIAKDRAVTAFEYDARDLLTKARDPNGGCWQFRRDDLGRVVERIDPLGQAEHFEYAGGDLVALHDAAGAVTALEYDSQHNLTCVYAPDGSTRQWQYDALGRVTCEIDANDNVARCSYDLTGRVVRVEEPDGSTRHLTYDGEGNALRIRDDQRDVEFAYRGLGTIVARTEGGKTLRFEYDAEEQLIGLRNAHGYAYRFERSPTGEVIAEYGLDGARTAYCRDLAGQVTSVTRPSGAVSEYRYDREGRVVAIAHADGTQERYRYRADGALLRAENGTARIGFERDRLGRVTRERVGLHWIASEYDARGGRIRMQSSFGAEQRIERDAMGRAVAACHVSQHAADPFEVRYGRDASGLEIERSLPGGVRSRWRRDRLGRPIEQTIGVGARAIRARGYEWGKDDRLLAVIDALRGAVRYGHDAAGQLAWARHEAGLAELRMPDAVGNLFRNEDRKDRRYGPAGQLLESIDGQGCSTAFTYDLDGNLIEKRRSTGECWRYGWAADGTLREVALPDGSVVQFGYDALGRRVHKRHRGRTTHFVWDGNVVLHEWVESDVERAAESEPITWLFDPDSMRPLAKLAAGARQAIVTDHLGTPTAMLDDRGVVTWSAEQGIWGELLRVEGERHACPFRWPGQYEDAETGLYYNRFRYYDPEVGCYVSQDPIGLEGGPAPYAYVHDPLTWTDPLGLAGCRANARLPRKRYRVPALHTLLETATSKPGGRKFQGVDDQGPVRVRVERAHPDDPSYAGPKDPLHTVDHLHVDRRSSGTTGKWQSCAKTSLPCPFDD